MLIACLLGCGHRSDSRFATAADIDYQRLKEGFFNVPMEARIRVWWFWMNGTATTKSITQDLEAMKANDIAGAILIDNGGDYAPIGPTFMSREWLELYAHAIREADRLGLEISINIQSGAGDPGNPNIANDNGLKRVTYSEKRVSGPGRVEMALPEPSQQIFYKDIAVQALRRPQPDTGKEALIKHWPLKTFNKKEVWNQDLDRYDLYHYYDCYAGNGKAQALGADDIIDLASYYDSKNGILTWDVPEGEWTIVRYGMTSTGKRNNYASEGYKGGLCYDPINQRGITAHFRDVAEPLIDMARKNGNSLKFVHVDSWEMGIVNWTQNFESEFKERRGYDLGPYLPVLTGRLVGNREISNRFLEDYRLTIGDLAVEYNYGLLKTLAESAGIAMHSESAGPHIPPVDGLRSLGVNDIPMGEAWARANTHRTTEGRRMHVKMGASASHIYGKRFFAAEIPTSVGPVWERSPADVKNVLDLAFCTGVNRVNWHTYTSSPDEYGLPGVEYFAGTHLNRHVTWWDQSNAFIAYINRTQHMLTHGIHVADVLGYLGSGVPLFGFLDSDREDVPDGYAWDMCNADVILNRSKIRNGRICLPDGKNYSLLALSEHRDISLPVLRKIEKMVRAGMVLVGKPPERASGLAGYPGSDEEVKTIVEKLWGDADGVNGFVNGYGKGRVYAGKTVAQVLEMEDIRPDLSWEPQKGVALEYIHHTSDEVDLYYLINKWAWKGFRELAYRNLPGLPDNHVRVQCSFRVDGERKIERWDPVTGNITPVEVFEQKDGYYSLPVSLEPEGGSFYVFTRAKMPPHVTSIYRDNKRLTAGNTPLEVGASRIFVKDGQMEALDSGEYRLRVAGGKEIRVNIPEFMNERVITGPWEVTFLEKPLLGEPFSSIFDSLISWTESGKHAIKYFSGTALYQNTFNLEESCISRGRAYLDLGKVGDIATIQLNGKEVGTCWKPPFIVDIKDFVKKGENNLEIEVSNLWVNRLIGDEKLPPEERRTCTNLVGDSSRYDKLRVGDADCYLRVSGLLGPVKIQFSQKYPVR
jgi:hypothetical protein